MPLIRNKSLQGSDAASKMVSEIRAVINEQGSGIATAAQTGQMISLESLQEHEFEALSRHTDTLAQTLKPALMLGLEDADIGSAGDDLTSQQLEAGAIVAMAAGNPTEYARRATSPVVTGDGVEIIEPEGSSLNGSLDFRAQPALESFDERELAKFLPYSIAFNVHASRQDEFSETFYPTVVVPPEQGGLDITVRRTTVYNAVHRNGKGGATDFKQKNLVDAAVDYTVLADQSTSLIPYIQEDGSNAAAFVGTGVIAPTFKTISGVEVRTSPLVFENKVDLIGISGHPALVGAGVLDHTDAVDGPIVLDKLYLSTATTNGDVISFTTQRLPSAGFLKTVEGLGREMELRFSSDDLILDAATLTVSGAVPASLAAIKTGNYTVRLAVRVSGEANVQFGNIELWSKAVKVASIQDEDGVEVGLTQGVGATIVTSLATAKLIGFDLKAQRTNSNRRTRGLLLDSQEVTRRYSIPLGAPISAPSPTGSNRDARDLEDLISAARLRNSNNAVTRLLDYFDTLEAYVRSGGRRNSVTGAPAVEGMGGYLVQPFFERIELDLEKELASLTDGDRAGDVSSLIVNTIRDVSYRMYRDSRYQPALNASATGSKSVKLLIGTDVYLPKHIMVSGDTRTFGIAFNEFAVVSTFDERLNNKIILTLTRGGAQEGPDPLSFGTHAWIPELASTLQVSRDGATYPEAMVQPRNLQINHMPIGAIIEVKGLTEVLKGKVDFPIVDNTPAPAGDPTP